MREIKWLQSMDRDEHVLPPIDVTSEVMQQISIMEREEEGKVPTWFAGVLVMATAAALVFEVSLWIREDPFRNFGSALDLVLR